MTTQSRARARIADAAIAIYAYHLMPCERNERAHRHVELAQLGGAPKVRQIDDEAAGEHLRAELAQELDRRPPPCRRWQ
jgi:hypothetical protein